MDIIDGSTSNHVKEILLIPYYSVGSGISPYSPEGDKGKRKYKEYIADPIVYNAGAPFNLQQEKSTGVLILGSAYAGKDTWLQGVIMLAPGFAPKLFSDLWTPNKRKLVSLQPLRREEAEKAVLDFLWTNKKSKISGRDCELIDLPSSCSVEIKLSKRGRELARKFIEKGKETERKSP
jgi:hypothetical protein